MCYVHYHIKYREDNAEKLRIAAKHSRIKFRKRRNADKAKWAANNKDKIKIKNAKWYQRTRETRLIRSSDEYLKNKAHRLLKSAQWHRDNKEKHNAMNAAWWKSHPELHRAKTVRYVATQLSATPKWVNDFFIKEAYHLARLRTKATSIKWHVDHIVPLRSKVVCGLHVEHNLQVIPEIENRIKSNRYWPDMPT